MNPLTIFILPLLGGLLLCLFPLSLGRLQGGYLLMGAVLVGMQSLLYPTAPLTPILLGLLAGELVHLLLVALLGAKLGSSNHGALLMGVGLFPWWWGGSYAVAYIGAFIIFIVVYSLLRTYLASRRYGVPTFNHRQAVQSIAEEHLEDFMRLTAFVVAPALFMAALMVGALFLRA